MGWLLVGQLVRQGIALVLIGLLARLVSLEAFGLVAMVVVFTAFLEMFQELGLSSAIIQHREPTEAQLATVFVITVALGAALSLLTAAAAPLVARFYGRPGLVTVTRLVGLNFLLVSLAHVPGALLRKSLQFKKVVCCDLVAVLASGAAGVTLALMGFGVYALVAKVLVESLALSVSLWALSGWRPRARPRLGSVGSMVRFGANMTGCGFLGYVARNADFMLIGRVLGAKALGPYSIAHRVTRMPVSRLTAQLSRVAFPAFSSVQDDDARMRRGFLELVGWISLASFPAMTGLVIVAPDAVSVLLGAKWLPAVVLIQVLALVGALASVTVNVAPIYRAKGRVHTQLRLEMIATPVLVAAFLLGLRRGVVGVACGYAVAQALLLPLKAHVAFRLIGLRWRDFYLAVRAPLRAAAVMGVVVTTLRALALSWLGLSQPALLAGEVTVGVVAYG